MLPRFRIRHLRSSNNPSGPDLGDDTISSPLHHGRDGDKNNNDDSDRESDDGVLQLNPADYDRIVFDCPDAVLTYLDDDDGELITIGTSLELTQRLAEPVVTPARPGPRTLTSTIDAGSHGKPMHIFDVNRSKRVLNLWRFLEAIPPPQPWSENEDRQPILVKGEEKGKGKGKVKEREKERKKGNGKAKRRARHGHHPSHDHGEDLEVQVDFHDDLTRFHELHHLRKAHRSRSMPRATVQILPPSDLSTGTTLTQEGIRQVHYPTHHHDDLAHRQRKAAEAGRTLMNRLGSAPQRQPDLSEPERDSHQRRWTSYGASVGVDPPSLATAPDANNETDRGRVGPALSITEAVAHPDAQTLRSFMEISDDSLRPAPAPLTQNASEGGPVGASPSVSAPATARSAREKGPTPAEGFANTLLSVMTTVSDLGAELKNVLAGVHEQLQGPLQHAPQAAEVIVRKAVEGFTTRVQDLAHAAQHASHLARNAAEQARQADVQASGAALAELSRTALSLSQYGQEIYARASPALAAAMAPSRVPEPGSSETPVDQETPGSIDAATEPAEDTVAKSPELECVALAGLPVDPVTDSRAIPHADDLGSPFDTRRRPVRTRHERGASPYHRRSDMQRSCFSRKPGRAFREYLDTVQTVPETEGGVNPPMAHAHHDRLRSRSPPPPSRVPSAPGYSPSRPYSWTLGTEGFAGLGRDVFAPSHPRPAPPPPPPPPPPPTSLLSFVPSPSHPWVRGFVPPLPPPPPVPARPDDRVPGPPRHHPHPLGHPHRFPAGPPRPLRHRQSWHPGTFAPPPPPMPQPAVTFTTPPRAQGHARPTRPSDRLPRVRGIHATVDPVADEMPARRHRATSPRRLPSGAQGVHALRRARTTVGSYHRPEALTDIRPPLIVDTTVAAVPSVSPSRWPEDGEHLGWARFQERYERIPGHFPEDEARRADTNIAEPAEGGAKTRTCTDQLVEMGFGTTEDGGRERLVVYAQAANGDVGAAMEMIEEDRKAHAERRRRAAALGPL
ncbi:MAG: hypothetical protein M1838_003802 [Thelocarpon superellum]|nr:MAG: hypothetical protein M1838_003802 [Thelocarpon superellum]